MIAAVKYCMSGCWKLPLLFSDEYASLCQNIRNVKLFAS